MLHIDVFCKAQKIPPKAWDNARLGGVCPGIAANCQGTEDNLWQIPTDVQGLLVDSLQCQELLVTSSLIGMSAFD